MDVVSIITCTGGRPEAFGRLEYYMKRQTYSGPVQWIVVDDFTPKTQIHFTRPGWTVEYHRGPKEWKQGVNTQRYNMDAGFAAVKGDYLFVVEDDDYYHPDFLSAFMHMLQRWPVVGEGNSKYYNLKERCWRIWMNWDRCSLCQTGMHRSMYPYMERAIHAGEIFMDMVLWRHLLAENKKPLLFAYQDYTVGMKGLPGKEGIGGGHGKNAGNRDMSQFTADPGFGKLREWLGDGDAQWYIDLALRGTKPVAQGVKPNVNGRR
jgi:hypothetical protein